MSAHPTLAQRLGRNVLVLPLAALQGGRGEQAVLRPAPTPGAEPVRVPVQTGLDDGSQAEILSGVQEGEVVLIPDGLPASTMSNKVNPLMPTRPGGRPPRR